MSLSTIRHCHTHPRGGANNDNQPNFHVQEICILNTELSAWYKVLKITYASKLLHGTSVQSTCES